MKAVGDYVIVKQLVNDYGAIVIKENNVGKVIDCKCDESLIGKTVVFSEMHEIQEYDGFKFVPISQVMAVME
tara:strand:- start:926 stop:1141 length:216 start_codon:yes stop_codon:yes gene_type:complete